MFYVYVLRSIKKVDQLYVGYTTDLDIRIKKHNDGNVLSTKPYRPWELIFYEVFSNIKDAKERERYFKTTKGRRALKLLIRHTLTR